jgi:hypothetical protein
MRLKRVTRMKYKILIDENKFGEEAEFEVCKRNFELFGMDKDRVYIIKEELTMPFIPLYIKEDNKNEDN